MASRDQSPNEGQGLKIRRAAVLGAGVMGAQIAAHLAAAGVRTYLLDLASAEPPKDPAQAKAVGKRFRSARAVLAVENLKALKPSPLYTPGCLAAIVPGNFDDDLSVLAECDWILEAVIERLDIKQDLHKKIAQYARPGVPVTTNTSGISLASIAEGLPEDYQKRFFGTHFFNPPRYMKLLEMIPHKTTDHRLYASLGQWIEDRLGKGLVDAKDTVNFIANRIGVFATQAALKHMADLKLNVETVDNLTGPLIGRAKSATLRTMDVVGLDTFMAVARNTYERAPKDPWRELFKGPRWIEELIEKGALGQKSGSVGTYKKDKDAKGQTAILAYRPETKTYEPQKPTVFPWEEAASKEKGTVNRIKFILSQKDAGADFVWRTIRDVSAYAAYLVDDIAGGLVKPVDDALRWGFNWEMGPFELWQALGHDLVLERMKKDGVTLAPWLKPGQEFYKPAPGTPEYAALGATSQLKAEGGSTRSVEIPRSKSRIRLPLADAKGHPKTVLSNKGASLMDVGDGCAALVFHAKMNAIDFDITEMIMKSVAAVSSGFQALIIANDHPQAFSAGANLKMILEAIQTKKWGDIEKLLREFQGALQMVKFAPFPSVSCPHGLVLGGGCEVALHTTIRAAAGETYAGLVEVGVGLIPAGGGTKELALRAYEAAGQGDKADPMPFLARAFQNIGMAKTSSSAHEAVEMGLFPGSGGAAGGTWGLGATVPVLARERVVEVAKRHALALVEDGYVPRSPASSVKVVGDPGINTFRMMLYNMREGAQITPYDAVVGEKVATVLCGGEVDAGTPVSEQWFLDLERRVFIELCQRPETAARIEHMLKTGKPLRN
jgi:3-hydroxyacyl-CoA dehydrogenase